MKIRGERSCTECGTRWSYYETGSVGCPACGSLRSVGVDEPTEHTDLETPFDLTGVRAAVDECSTSELASRAREEAKAYVRKRGFISGGTLKPLEDTYLAAVELQYVADTVSRRRTTLEDEALYFLGLLREADQGEYPPEASIPKTLRADRGLAYADAVDAYRRELRTWLEGRAVTPEERSTLALLGEHVTRVQLLEGDVSPETARTLVEAARDLARAVSEGDEPALSRARDRLERLSV
ncbi:DUF7117 family protein [Natronobiforma cellulositropha]|uniref:DUF7117 family protein n=1 Tax=Natronobiforma cellulositropha TaxID=1679076 RepID=UPI0021D5C86D|nr:TFIIB-type zinc ribbon-containing protein [Natronobiforma cellulositropha]